MPDPRDMEAQPSANRSTLRRISVIVAGGIAIGLACFSWQYAVPVWRAHRLIRDYESGFPIVLNNAVEDIGGPRRAAHALSVLLRLGPSDQHYRLMAMDLLGQCGPDGTRVLVETLKHDDPGIRSHAVSVLARIYPRSPEVLPELANALRDSDEQVRSAAASVMIFLGEDARPVQREIIRALADESAAVRVCAALAMLRMKVDKAAAMAALSKDLTAKDWRTRQKAAAFIGALGPEASECSALLESCLADEDPDTRATVAVSLWCVTGKNEKPLQSLRAMLKSSAVHERAVAEDAIKAIVPGGRPGSGPE